MRFELYWLVFWGIILVRYFLVAGTTYLFFYSFENKFDVESRLLRKKSIKQDIQLSVLAAIVLAVCAAFVMFSYDWGLTRLYSSLNLYGLWYLGGSFIGILFLQDTCFYFIHRLLHHPKIFKQLHSGHHYSRQPTPWTSFALDPPEAFLQGLFLLVVVFIIPLHFLVLIGLLLTMTLWAVLNHLGLELFDSFLARHWLGRWLIASTYHSMHHQNYQVHYGLYFTFWDRLLDTYDSSYESNFKELLK